jgi:hypothetical protein
MKFEQGHVDMNIVFKRYYLVLDYRKKRKLTLWQLAKVYNKIYKIFIQIDFILVSAVC